MGAFFDFLTRGPYTYALHTMWKNDGPYEYKRSSSISTGCLSVPGRSCRVLVAIAKEAKARKYELSLPRQREREVVPRLKTENSVETSGNRPWCEVSQSSLVVWGDSKTYDRRR